ncbi:hypothetical protein GOB57_09760 [Sinorhizobium meliloti]|nr:hypothetical protein [Sinorhizobium meliloti]
MSGYTHPADVIVYEIHEMRDRIATAARNEADPVSYRAYLLQARSLRSIEEQVASSNAAAKCRAAREDTADEAQVESYWVSMLADWLRDHEKLTRDSLEGGDTDRLPFAVTGEEARAICRLHAQRHHEMIADFARRHIATLRARADELERGIVASSELRPSYKPSPRP